MNTAQQKTQKKTQQLVVKLSFLVVLMFGFSFALVPLYTVFCKVTGLNGKVELNRSASYDHYNQDIVNNQNFVTERKIIVEFDVNRNEKIPCEIVPKHPVLQVNPGVLCSTSYSIKNLTGKKMVIQAIPSISPGVVAKYLKKLECFCFTPQELKPYESQQFALRFWLEPEIPDHVYRLTLSYTLFDVTKAMTKEKESGT